MIQRVQSLFLVLAALSLASEYLFDDVWTGVAAESFAWFTPVTTALFGIGAVGAIGAIFLYGDRSRQRRFVVLLQILTVLGVVALFAGHYLAGSLPIAAAEGAQVSDWLSLSLPLVAYVFLYLSRRGIEKDMDLVATMDRLR